MLTGKSPQPMPESMPDPGPQPEVAGKTAAEPKAPSAAYHWYQKLLALVGVILCFEMGVFLIVFPWASEWDANYFSRLPFWAREIWVSPYFRGAVSGLGLVDIYISFLEVFRLRRFSS